MSIIYVTDSDKHCCLHIMVHYAPLAHQIHGDYKTLWLQHHMNMKLSAKCKHKYSIVAVLLQCC